MDKVFFSIFVRKIVFFFFHERCFKHLGTLIIQDVFVVRYAMNVLMVFHLLLIRIDVYFVYTIIISEIIMFRKHSDFYECIFQYLCSAMCEMWLSNLSRRSRRMRKFKQIIFLPLNRVRMKPLVLLL